MVTRMQNVDCAATHRLGLISEDKVFAAAGALRTYGPSRLDLARHAAYYVDRVLTGTKPADLPKGVRSPLDP